MRLDYETIVVSFVYVENVGITTEQSFVQLEENDMEISIQFNSVKRFITLQRGNVSVFKIDSLTKKDKTQIAYTKKTH